MDYGTIQAEAATGWLRALKRRPIKRAADDPEERGGGRLPLRLKKHSAWGGTGDIPCCLIAKSLAVRNIDAVSAGFPCLDIETVKRSSGHTQQKTRNHDLVDEGRAHHAQTLPASG